MGDITGHDDLISNGFDYQFTQGFQYLSDMDASRATPNLFQTYPDNNVQGLAQLMVQDDGVPGKYFSCFQPAQVVVDQSAILASMIWGGVNTGSLNFQPLISPTE